jgi:hypothetical protein
VRSAKCAAYGCLFAMAGCCVVQQSELRARVAQTVRVPSFRPDVTLRYVTAEQCQSVPYLNVRWQAGREPNERRGLVASVRLVYFTKAEKLLVAVLSIMSQRYVTDRVPRGCAVFWGVVSVSIPN